MEILIVINGPDKAAIDQAAQSVLKLTGWLTDNIEPDRLVVTATVTTFTMALELDSSIEYLLSVRTSNQLMREGIVRIRDLVRYTEAEILGIKNIGPTVLDEIVTCLARYGFALKDEPSDTPDLKE